MSLVRFLLLKRGLLEISPASLLLHLQNISISISIAQGHISCTHLTFLTISQQAILIFSGRSLSTSFFVAFSFLRPLLIHFMLPSELVPLSLPLNHRNAFCWSLFIGNQNNILLLRRTFPSILCIHMGILN